MKYLTLKSPLLVLTAMASLAAFSQNSEQDLENCSVNQCKTDDGIIVEIITKGESEAKAKAIAEDRKVEVSLDAANYKETPSKVMGNFIARMPVGGVFWATEDPAITAPRLSVNSSQVAKFDGENSYPVRFNYSTNYDAFIEKLELSVYLASDTDLIEPIYQKTIKEVSNFGDFTWDEKIDSKHDVVVGDSLIYVLRAYDANGNLDETQAKSIQLITPEEYGSGLYLDSSNNGQVSSQFNNSNSQQTVGQTIGQTINSTDNNIASLSTYGANELVKQNIPIRGSRVRIFGQDIPEGYNVEINGKSFPIDLQRKLAAEFLLPVGQHQFDLKLNGEQGAVSKTLNVDVSGKYMFLAALADITASENAIIGNIEPIASDDRYDDDLLIEGRLAFYAKGKVKGKYLITAHADTQEREISKLFDGFLDKDPVDIFRRLDPDKYYPVYGDDSTTTRDVDTQGRMYVRVDWDKSLALWGNYNTGLTPSEIIQYNRSLYGGALDYQATESNKYGESKTQIKAFVSESQTAYGHSEFLGTGGSLYYLRHTDILPGSDKVTIEVRDPDTGLTVERVDLVRDADYEVDEIQGRIILSKPLFSFTRDSAFGIVRDEPVDGNQLVMLVDYEYLPAGFDANHLTAGGRLKKWFGDSVAIGVTYVDENRAGDDYELAGVDLTLQAGKGTYLKLEKAETNNTQAPIFYSDNGGLTFTESNALDSNLKGDAHVIEGRVNFKELGYSKDELALNVWHKKTDGGFSIASRDFDNKVIEQGAQVSGKYSRYGTISTSVSSQESGDNKLEQASVVVQQKLSATGTITGELKQVQETTTGVESDALLSAFEYRQRVTSNWELYGVAQATIDADATYDNNDLFTLGSKYLFAGRSSLGTEYSTGHRGDAANLTFEYQVNNDHSIYSRYNWSTDTTSPLISNFNRNGFTLGHRSRITNNLNIYNERQMINSGPETGVVQVFGLNYYLDRGWTLGASMQTGDLTIISGDVERNAATISAGFRDPDMEWLSKVEYREDKGVEQQTQWLTTNRLNYKINDSWRLAAKYNFSDTEDLLLPEADAKFVEGSVGFAYRPYDNNRWNLLGKYTYLYDLRSLSQTSFGTDQKSDIYTLEGTYLLNAEWELAGKLGRRTGQLREARGEGSFFKSTVNFHALQARYHLLKEWDALAEFRNLEVVESNSNRNGWLVGVDRHIGNHFKIGIGYNFTDFSDDLRLNDYEYKGWYISLIGKY